MKLKIENIGKIKCADIDLSSITVITGVNGTGKSTVAKSLFSAFNGMANTYNQIQNDRDYSLTRLVISSSAGISKAFKFRNELLKNKNDITKVQMIAKKYLDDEEIEFFMKRYEDIMSVNDKEILDLIIERRFNREFNNQINNIYNNKEGKINLTIKDKTTEFFIENNKFKQINNIMELGTEAVYIDDFKCIENIEYRNENEEDDDVLRIMGLLSSDINEVNHKSHLYRKIKILNTNGVIEEILNMNKFESIFQDVFKDFPGKMTISKNSKLQYSLEGTDKAIDIRNIAEGMKNFLIIKLLINQEKLLENGVLILDEPEIHLHPEWQLLFAELIVLINKHLKTHILINTHSPYFLDAIGVYSKKHGISDDKYYLAELDGNIYDVTNELERAYIKLARPLQELEDEESENY